MSSCPAPENELVITSQGRLAPCCAYQGSMEKITDLLGDTSHQIASGFIHLNKIFAQSATPMGCGECFRREYQGLISKRNKLIRHREIEPNIQKHIEISFSNSCNLDCVMCTSLFSTKMKKLHQLFLNSESPRLRAHHTFYFNKSESYTLTQEETVKLAKGLPPTQSIEIIGGEPLSFKHIVTFIKTLIEIDHEPQRLRIVTNGTLINHELNKVLTSLQNTEITISLSIDGVDEVYEYIRGFNFPQLEKNLLFYTNQNWVDKLFIKPTLSLINFHQLIPLCQWVSKIDNPKIDLLFDQFLHNDEPLSATCLPQDYRTELIQTWLSSNFYQKKMKNRIDRVINQLQSYPDPSEEQLRSNAENIRVLDIHRGKRLAEIAPELSFLYL